MPVIGKPEPQKLYVQIREPKGSQKRLGKRKSTGLTIVGYSLEEAEAIITKAFEPKKGQS